MPETTYTALAWDEDGKRFYETGVKKGVLYQKQTDGSYDNGVAWNGLTAVTESPSGAEANPLYADNIKYLNLMSAEEVTATLEAYTYPDEFAECDGSVEVVPGVLVGQQKRKPFGLSYVTAVGNDEDDIDYGYKIHLLYGAMAAPSERAYATINDTPEAITFSWELTTTAVPVPNKKPTALIVIDSKKCDAVKLAAFEKILYGTTTTVEPAVTGAAARMPLPAEVLTLLAVAEG